MLACVLQTSGALERSGRGFKLPLSSLPNAARPPLARFSLKAPSLNSLSWPRCSRSNECLPYTGGSQTEPGSNLHKLYTWDVVQRDHQKRMLSTLPVHTLPFAVLGLLYGWKGKKACLNFRGRPIKLFSSLFS